MAYTSGKHTLAWNSRRAHSPWSIILARISFLTTVHNSTKTRRSFGGTCIRLAGGTIAYKCKFQPTIAGSSTEAEFMAAYNTGKMILFIRSVLWDFHVPQKQLQFCSKTMTFALLWAMHRNLLPEPDISTLNTSLCAIGWNATSCSLSVSIHLSICQTI